MGLKLDRLACIFIDVGLTAPCIGVTLLVVSYKALNPMLLIERIPPALGVFHISS